MTFTMRVPGTRRGTWSETTENLRTPDPKQLFDKRKRGKRAGKWPTLAELGDEQAALYGLHFADVTGTFDYSTIADTRITPAQRKAMKDAGWPAGAVANPDGGPPGLRCRGWSEPVGLADTAVEALKFQQLYASLIDQKMDKVCVRNIEFTNIYHFLNININKNQMKSQTNIKIH